MLVIIEMIGISIASIVLTSAYDALKDFMTSLEKEQEAM